MGACAACSEPLTQQGRARKWCSEACRQWALRNPGQTRVVARECRSCGAAIRPPKRNWCSKRCNDVARGMVLPREPERRVSAEAVAAAYAAELEKRRERTRAYMRAKNYVRRGRMGYGDVTPEYERRMRAAAKRCPLCRVRMVDAPYLPASKELDHMIPLNVGGTHTIGNVRIICRACNQGRPKDGSDYTGPVTLWALEVSHAESAEVGSAAWFPRPGHHDAAGAGARRRPAAVAASGADERR